MKKLILMLLMITGGVMSASADDYYLSVNAYNNWTNVASQKSSFNNDGDWNLALAASNKLTPNSDGTYSIIFRVPNNVNNSEYKYYFIVYTQENQQGTSLRPYYGTDTDITVYSSGTYSTTQSNGAFYLATGSSSAGAIKLTINPADNSYKFTEGIIAYGDFNSWNTFDTFLPKVSNHKYEGLINLTDGAMKLFVGDQNANNTNVYNAGTSNEQGHLTATNANNIQTSAGLTKVTVNLNDWTYSMSTSEVVNVTNASYATYSCAYPVTIPANDDNIAAYRADRINNNGEIIFKKVSGDIAAGTGLLLKSINGGEANTTFSYVANGSEVSNNMMVGTPTLTDVPASTTGSYNYMLANTSGIGFYNVAAATTSAAGKAYLHTTTPLKSASSARVAWSFEDDTTTGIDAVKNEKLSNEVYNLNGQRVNNATRGLYIVNGKKVIMK